MLKGLQAPQPRGLTTQRSLHAQLHRKLVIGEEGAPGIVQVSLPPSSFQLTPRLASVLFLFLLPHGPLLWILLQG